MFLVVKTRPKRLFLEKKMSDFEWFCDEVEEVALRLGLHLTPTEGVNPETRGRWALNNEENFTIATTEISNQSENEEKSEEKNQEKNSMAFEVQITPKQKSKVATKSPGTFLLVVFLIYERFLRKIRLVFYS